MSTVESQPAYSDARLLVVMGSSGCGKSTVGNALAQRLNAVFIAVSYTHLTLPTMLLV